VESVKHLSNQVVGKSVDRVAKMGFPEGTIARCVKCGFERHASTSEIALWLSSGLPRCKRCGIRVHLRNPFRPND
jgi:hypothetical protein